MRKMLFIMTVCIIPLVSMAQDDIVVVEKNTRWSGFVSNDLWDNWFISADFGGSVYFSGFDSRGKFGKRIAPTVDLSVGKWFMPTLGARVRIGGFTLKGFTVFPDNPYVDGIEKEGVYKQKWQQYNISGDVMLNISSWIGGYRPSRLYEAVPYAGAGMMHAYSKEVNNVFTVNGGIYNKFRISNSFDANVDIRASFFSSKFSYENTARLNKILTVEAGITYNINNREFQRSMAPVVAAEDLELAVTSSKLQEAQQALTQQMQQNDDLEKQIRYLQVQVQQEKKQEVAVATTPRAIFFHINSAYISSQEKVNLKYMADIMRQNPDQKYTITGYADAATGSPEYNLKLSTKRAENVMHILIKEFGVNPAQLTAIGKGGVSSKTLFNKNPLNRVVVIE